MNLCLFRHLWQHPKQWIEGGRIGTFRKCGRCGQLEPEWKSKTDPVNEGAETFSGFEYEVNDADSLREN